MYDPFQPRKLSAALRGAFQVLDEAQLLLGAILPHGGTSHLAGGAGVARSAPLPREPSPIAGPLWPIGPNRGASSRIQARFKRLEVGANQFLQLAGQLTTRRLLQAPINSVDILKGNPDMYLHYGCRYKYACIHYVDKCTLNVGNRTMK